jgi:hypothetical protein
MSYLQLNAPRSYGNSISSVLDIISHYSSYSMAYFQQYGPQYSNKSMSYLHLEVHNFNVSQSSLHGSLL